MTTTTERPRLPGKFVWFNHESADPRRAQAFYGELFGWRTQPFSAGGPRPYEMIAIGDDRIGGYAKIEEGAPARWLASVSVEDVDAAARAVATAGGRVLDAPMPIPRVGRIARVADPQGAELHLFESEGGDPPDVGRAVHGRWAWNELHTPDAARALAFYGDVVGFAHEAMSMGPGGVYHVLKSKDGAGRGGLSTHLPCGTTAHWLPYLFVDEADESVERARLLGASVQMPPMDIPKAGRVAVLQDPTGAAIAFIKPSPEM